MKTAIVVGSTGLVGRQVLRLLTEDDTFTEIKILTRKHSGFIHDKVKEYVVDFDNFSRFKDIVKGDVLFSCMGTTLKKAGSKVEQYKVDYTYQYEIANAASANGVKDYILISSAGAKENALLFYPRMKGQLDKAVQHLPFERIRIVRPSVLMGDREEQRPGEKTFAQTINTIGKIIKPLQKYRGIYDVEVARAMIQLVKETDNTHYKIVELDELFLYL